MKKSIVLLLGLILSFSICMAQEPIKIIEQFFSTYPKNIDKAVSDMFKTNVSYKNNKEEVVKLSNKLISDINKMGIYFGYEYIAESKVGQSLIHYSYLVKYELHPVRFSFIFYNIGERWVLFKFSYDTNIILELEESAKFYYLE